MELEINGEKRTVEQASDTPLLWALREELGLTGTKFGCGQSLCGACTVLVDGESVRSCQFPLAAASGKKITTIEGLSRDSSHPVQKAWLEIDVPQCGYCQSGMIMATVALLKRTPLPTDSDIDSALSNICRCGTYNRIRQAVHRAAQLTNKSS